jgi:hypothetical protein
MAILPKQMADSLIAAFEDLDGMLDNSQKVSAH